MSDERSCNYVSSRGLLKICDKRNAHPESSSRHIDENILDGLQDYDVIHICSWLTITIFMKKYAKEIKKKVIIVTNDSDMDAPVFEKEVGKGDEIGKEEILEFLNSDNCVHWFTQNCTLRHPKVSPIPIGMDYHTFSHYLSPKLQEDLLNVIKDESTHFSERSVLCYGNYHFTMDGKYYTSDRYDCFDNTPKELCYYEPTKVDRENTWIAQCNYAFVLSPAGGGYDCHRTWEALILGCIPIMKRFNIPLEDIYNDLPVLLVDNWSDVNIELLTETIQKFKERKFNYDILKLDYWKNKIYSYKEAA